MRSGHLNSKDNIESLMTRKEVPRPQKANSRLKVHTSLRPISIRSWKAWSSCFLDDVVVGYLQKIAPCFQLSLCLYPLQWDFSAIPSPCGVYFSAPKTGLTPQILLPKECSGSDCVRSQEALCTPAACTLLLSHMESMG